MGQKEEEKMEKDKLKNSPCAAVPAAATSVKKLAEEEKEKQTTMKNEIQHKLENEERDCAKSAKAIAEHKAIEVAQKLQQQSTNQMFKPLMEETSRVATAEARKIASKVAQAVVNGGSAEDETEASEKQEEKKQEKAKEEK